MNETALSHRKVLSDRAKSRPRRRISSSEQRRLSSIGAGLLLGTFGILCAIFAFTHLEYVALLGTPMGSVAAMVLSFLAAFSGLALALFCGKRSSWGFAVATLVCFAITLTDMFVHQQSSHPGLLDAASTVTGWSTFLPGLTGIYAGAWYATWRARRLAYDSHLKYLAEFDTTELDATSPSAKGTEAPNLTYVIDPAVGAPRGKLEIATQFLPAIFFSLVIIALALWQASGVLIAGPMPPVSSSLSPQLLVLAEVMTFLSCFGLVAVSARCAYAPAITSVLLLLTLSFVQSFYAIMTLRVVVPGDLWAISTGLAAPLVGILGINAAALSLSAYWARMEGIRRATQRWKRIHDLT